MSEKKLNRRDLLKKGGALGAGAVAAGALAGPAGAALGRRRRAQRDAEARRQGHVGARAGPRSHRAVRRDPHDRPARRRSRCTSRCSSGTRTSTSSRRSRAGYVDQGLEDDRLQHPPGHQVPERPAESPRTTSSLLVRPAARTRRCRAASRCSARCRRSPASRALGNKARMHLKSPDARIFGYLAWQRYSSIVPKDMYTTGQRGDAGDRHGPVQARRLVRPERPHQLRAEPELLEEGPAVPRRDQLPDHHRRAGAHRGAARRRDRRRDRLGRQRQRAQGRQRPEGAEAA